MLVVGTSCAVAPAGTLPYAALSNGCFVIEVNPERCLRDEVPIDPGDDGRPVMTYGDVKEFGDRQIHLAGRAGTVLPALAAAVRGGEGAAEAS